METLTVGKYTYQVETTESEVIGRVQRRRGPLTEAFRLVRPQGIELDAFQFQKATYWAYFLRGMEPSAAQEIEETDILMTTSLGAGQKNKNIRIGLLEFLAIVNRHNRQALLPEAAKRELAQYLVGHRYLAGITLPDAISSRFDKHQTIRWNQRNPGQEIAMSHYKTLVKRPSKILPEPMEYFVYAGWNQSEKKEFRLGDWADMEALGRLFLYLKEEHQLTILETFDWATVASEIQDCPIRLDLSDIGEKNPPRLTAHTLIDWLSYQIRKGAHPEQIALQLWWAEHQ